jgi:Mg2+-importing ATPase
LGIAVLAGVIIAATHFSEEEAFVRLTRQAEPPWLIAALLLQAATYLAQGEIWRSVARAAGTSLQLPLVYKLALAKLFVDQALPSAGVSGTMVVAQVLERGALPRAAVLAGAVINTTSFFISYIAALGMSLAILFYFGRMHSVILASATLFMLLSAALAAGMLMLTGKEIARAPRWPHRYRIVRNALDILKDADRGLVHNVRLQVIASGYQFATFLLDALTLWVLVRSLGTPADASYVFASFMIANLVRTLSIIPGGLGTFEATVVLMLRTGGVSLAAGLSTALLFRGLTFFLPMAPGLWFSRRLVSSTILLAVLTFAVPYLPLNL